MKIAVINIDFLSLCMRAALHAGDSPMARAKNKTLSAAQSLACNVRLPKQWPLNTNPGRPPNSDLPGNSRIWLGTALRHTQTTGEQLRNENALAS